MSRLLVIGIGSLLMTDDGIGTRIAHRLGGSLGEQGAYALAGETDYQYCLDEIRPDDFLVVIDAVTRGEEPGSLAIAPLHVALKGRGGIKTQHDFSLLDAVSVSYPEMRGYVIGVEASVIGPGFDLSPALSEGFEEICEKVLAAVIELKEEAERA